MGTFSTIRWPPGSYLPHPACASLPFGCSWVLAFVINGKYKWSLFLSSVSRSSKLLNLRSYKNPWICRQSVRCGGGQDLWLASKVGVVLWDRALELVIHDLILNPGSVRIEMNYWTAGWCWKIRELVMEKKKACSQPCGRCPVNSSYFYNYKIIIVITTSPLLQPLQTSAETCECFLLVFPSAQNLSQFRHLYLWLRN